MYIWDFRVTSITELNKEKQKLHCKWFQSCVKMQKTWLQMNKSRGKARKDRVLFLKPSLKTSICAILTVFCLLICGFLASSFKMFLCGNVCSPLGIVLKISQRTFIHWIQNFSSSKKPYCSSKRILSSWCGSMHQDYVMYLSIESSNFAHTSTAVVVCFQDLRILFVLIDN